MIASGRARGSLFKCGFLIYSYLKLKSRRPESPDDFEFTVYNIVFTKYNYHMVTL